MTDSWLCTIAYPYLQVNATVGLLMRFAVGSQSVRLQSAIAVSTETEPTRTEIQPIKRERARRSSQVEQC